jgi:hypothetical protein
MKVKEIAKPKLYAWNYHIESIDILKCTFIFISTYKNPIETIGTQFLIKKILNRWRKYDQVHWEYIVSKPWDKILVYNI